MRGSCILADGLAIAGLAKHVHFKRDADSGQRLLGKRHSFLHRKSSATASVGDRVMSAVSASC